jgi:hypothetical protein
VTPHFLELLECFPGSALALFGGWSSWAFSSPG